MRDSTRYILSSLLGSGIGSVLIFFYKVYRFDPMYLLVTAAGLVLFLLVILIRALEDEEIALRKAQRSGICHYCIQYKEGVTTCRNDHFRFSHCYDCCNKLGLEIPVD